MPNNTLKKYLQKKPVHCSYECYWCIYVNTYHVHYSITKIKDTLIKQCNTRLKYGNLYNWRKWNRLWTWYLLLVCMISEVEPQQYIVALTIEIMPWRSFKCVHNAKFFFGNSVYVRHVEWRAVSVRYKDGGPLSCLVLLRHC